MEGKLLDFEALQERHLDLMIRLAFEQEEAEAVQQILDASEMEHTSQEQALAARVWATAQAKMDAFEKKARHAKHVNDAKRIIPRVLQGIACLILACAIAMPIAYASSAEFRARVRQLLVSIDSEQNQAHFSFVEDRDAAFFVPEGWTGEYFPAYIPENMEEKWRCEYMSVIEYADKTGSGFSFSELTEDAGASAGTENTTIHYADINGASACVIEGFTGEIYTLTIVWANDEKWFMLCCDNMELDHAMRIAKSVRKISK